MVGGHDLVHGAADTDEPRLLEGGEPEGSEDEVEEGCEEDGDGVVTDGVHGAFPTAESEFRPCAMCGIVADGCGLG